MKPSWAKQEVYSHFDGFLQKSILGNDSYITNDVGIFVAKYIDECVHHFSDNPDEGSRSFDEKAEEQFANTSNEANLIFTHFIWLWCLSDSKSHDWGKQNIVRRFIGKEIELKDVFVSGGIGSSGQRHKRQKPNEINYLLLLFRFIKANLNTFNIADVQDLKRVIEKICKALYYKNFTGINIDDERLKKAGDAYLAMHHILLHLVNPNKYEAIAAQKDKNAIVNTFFSLLDKDNTEGLYEDIDDTIYQIRNKLCEIYEEDIDSFYDDGDIEAAWKFEETKYDISEVTLFEYKKGIIFYGPPGTSKTYSAERLARLLITKHYFRNKQNIKKYFEGSDEIYHNYIHHLQLHSNYNYEDFIAGLQIEGKNTIVKPGFLLNLIKEIQDDSMPHVLILDEINRTDISRLFGELFSAIEYRNKKIKLSVGNLEIAVPSNLYIIGTMNEIDFSLERVDFALRRRFLWQFKGFETDSLFSMIRQKRALYSLRINDDDIDTYVNRCTRLNEEVSTMPELGENYQIGHTFFSEVVDIFKSFKEIHSSRIYFLVEPVNVLWEISIKPIIEAFFGNMDNDSKKEKLIQLQQAFTNG